MDLKTTATTAHLVIQSAIQLLEHNGIDISNVKFQVGSVEAGGYVSPEIDFHAMVELALKQLDKIKKSEGGQICEWTDADKLLPKLDTKVIVGFDDDCEPEFDYLTTDENENECFANYGDEVKYWLSIPKLPHEIHEGKHD